LLPDHVKILYDLTEIIFVGNRYRINTGKKNLLLQLVAKALIICPKLSLTDITSATGYDKELTAELSLTILSSLRKPLIITTKTLSFTEKGR